MYTGRTVLNKVILYLEPTTLDSLDSAIYECLLN